MNIKMAPQFNPLYNHYLNYLNLLFKKINLICFLTRALERKILNQIIILLNRKAPFKIKVKIGATHKNEF
jgi:hypothetical protein